MTRVLIDGTPMNVDKDVLSFDDILVLAKKGGAAWLVIVHEPGKDAYALGSNGSVTVRPGLALKVVGNLPTGRR